MKKVIAILIAAMMFVMNVCAAGDRISLDEVYAEVTIPEGYKTLTPLNIAENEEFLKKINTTAEEKQKWFSDGYVQIESFSPDLNTEIIIQVYEIEGLQVYDLKDAKEEAIVTLEDNIKSDKNFEYVNSERIQTDKALFIKVERNSVYTGEPAMSYITVKNGAVYIVSVEKMNTSEFSDEDMEIADLVFKSFTFTEEIKDPNRYDWVGWVLIFIAICVIGVLLYFIGKRVMNWGNKSAIMDEKMKRNQRNMKKRLK